MNQTLKTSVVAIALAGGGVIGVGSLAAASYGDEPPTLDDVTETTDEDTTDDAGDETEGADDAEPTGLQTVDDTEADETDEADENCNRGGQNSEAVADALGMTTDELSEARASGQSLADIAGAQGVAVDVVVDALVDGIEQHLADEVAEGELTQAEADARLAAAEQRATDKVDAEPGERGLRGLRGRGGPAAADADVTTDITADAC